MRRHIKTGRPLVAEKKEKQIRMIMGLEYELEKTRSELDLLRMRVREYQETQVQLIRQIKYLKHLYE